MFNSFLLSFFFLQNSYRFTARKNEHKNEEKNLVNFIEQSNNINEKKTLTKNTNKMKKTKDKRLQDNKKKTRNK